MENTRTDNARKQPRAVYSSVQLTLVNIVQFSRQENMTEAQISLREMNLWKGGESFPGEHSPPLRCPAGGDPEGGSHLQRIDPLFKRVARQWEI